MSIKRIFQNGWKLSKHPVSLPRQTRVRELGGLVRVTDHLWFTPFCVLALLEGVDSREDRLSGVDPP